MIKGFNAEFVYGQIDAQDILLGFSDHENNPKTFLLLQKQLTDREIRLTYCDRSRSAKGGIVKFVLYPNKAELSFSAQTAKKLAVDEQIEIAFTVDEKKRAAIKMVLENLFQGDQHALLCRV